jgi:hypothetical protein
LLGEIQPNREERSDRQPFEMIGWRARISIIPLPFLIAASWQGQDQVPPEIRVTEVMDRPGFQMIRVLGVCDITASGANCWDMKGNPFKSLSERITAYYLVQSGSTITVRPGAKNRWVAVERTDQNQSKMQFYSYASGHHEGSVSGWRNGSTLEWVRIDSIAEDATGQLEIQYSKELPSADLDVKVGAMAEFLDGHIAVKSIQQQKSAELESIGFPSPMGGKYRIGLRLSGRARSSSGFWGITLLDRDGKQIFAVDRDGKPTPTLGFGGNRYLSANPSLSRVDTDHADLTMNVNPKYVSRLRFSQREIQKVIFENIPLDPVSK